MGRLYIYLHEWLIFMVNVGKYIPCMDGMGSIQGTKLSTLTLIYKGISQLRFATVWWLEKNNTYSSKWWLTGDESHDGM